MYDEIEHPPSPHTHAHTHAHTHIPHMHIPVQQDYQTYVSRKALKRQSLIVSLSDHNQQQLREIQRQREELVKDYEEKRAG